jgi:hypothetical protein
MHTNNLSHKIILYFITFVFFYMYNVSIKECKYIKSYVEFEYTGCRKINVFQVEGLVGKNLRNLEKIK